MAMPPKATVAFSEGAAAFSPDSGTNCPYPYAWRKSRLAWRDGYASAMRAAENGEQP